MPNLNEYYQLLQKEEPPLSNNALREMLASAMERADKEALDEALAAPQATASVRRSRLHGTGIVASTAAIITLSFWGFTYFQSQQSSAPRVQQETVQSGKNEVGTVGNATTTEENTSRSTDTQYNAQQTDQFLQPPFAAISHTTRPQTNSGVTTTLADTITKNNTTQTEPYPADSLLPEDFRSWEMPSYLAWAVAQRRYTDARGVLDSLLLRKQESPNTKFNLLCLRGHLHKIMGSVNASIADYSSALDMHESSELYLLRAIQYRTANQHQEALQDFTNAIRLNPYNTQAMFMRGTTAYKIGRLQEACSDWLAAAEMGNTSADSMLKVKCNPAVVQTIRTAQTKRLQAIKTLALLIERTKESIDKAPSSNLPLPSLKNVVEALVKKIFSSGCDLQTVLKGEASAYCAFQALHTIALELQDDSLALLVKPALEKKTTYSNSAAAQRSESNSTIPIGVTEIVSVLDQKVLATMNGKTVRTSGIDPILTNSRSNTSRSRYSNRMGGNNSIAQNQTLPPEILHNVIQAIEKYCRTTYPEIAAQAPSSVKTETTVQTLSPPAQQDTVRTSQTSMNTTDSRTDEASVLAPIVPDTKKTLQSTNNSIGYSAHQTTAKSTITVAKPTENPSWQYGKRLYQQQYSLLDQLTLIALSQVGVKTTFSQLLAPCTLSSALAGKSSSDCVLSLLEQYATQIQDSTLQAHAILAQRYRNYQMPSTPKAFEPSTPSDTYKSIPVETLPRTLESARNPIREEILIRVVEEMPKSTSEPAKPNDDAFVYLYPQVLLNVQKHTWKVLDAIEDTTVSRPHAERESNATKDIGDMPIWFQELVQARRYLFARNIIDSMLTQESRTAELYTLRGDMNKAMDSVEASITDYSQALSFQESSALYMQRGTQYFTASKRQEAYDDFTSAMRLDPKNYQAVYMRGAAAYNLKRFEEACDDWSLAAQMGHPLADSVMAAKCAGYVPRYTRTAMAEAKQRITNTVLLLNTLQNKLQSTRTPFPKDHMPQLDSLSYRAFGSSCNTNNVTDNTISPFCMVHLLYSLALELHDLVAIDFAQKIWTRMAAATSPFDRTKNGQNMYNRIDRTDYNEIIVKEVANGGSTDKIRSLQSKQAMQSAIRATQEAHQMNSPSGISPTQYQDIVQLLQQMQKYYHVQYAEFLDSK